jgi:putative transposase
MPQAKRERRERTDNYHLLQRWCRTPEQRLYEGIRPVVLFGLPPAERAQETSLAERSLRRASDAFDTHGMISLFRPTKAQREDHHRSLPVAMRQLIVDLKAEYADFTTGEIAAICAIQFAGRRPSHHTVQAVLADGPPPQRTQRQFPHYVEMGTPEERRQAVIRLHAQGWSISTIARYLDVSRPTIYAILKRWVEEGVRGLPDKSRANTSKPGVDLPTRNLIRKKQEENPLLGEWRMYAALKQLGISVSPRTCGRIMAENRRLYGIQPKPGEPHKPKPHPFKASARHERWCLDIRYLEKHRIPEIKGSFYVITVMDAFSRAILSSDIFQSQDLSCVLIVLYAAVERFGAPRKLITDNGGVFRAKQLLAICEALDIEKEYIHRRQSWENLVIWLHGDALTVEYQETPLAQYTVRYQPDRTHFKAVPESRRFETPYHSLQGRLWELDETLWHLAKRLPDYAPRKKRRPTTAATQLPLGEAFLAGQQGAEENEHGNLLRARKDPRGEEGDWKT